MTKRNNRKQRGHSPDQIECGLDGSRLDKIFPFFDSRALDQLLQLNGAEAKKTAKSKAKEKAIDRKLDLAKAFWNLDSYSATAQLFDCDRAEVLRAETWVLERLRIHLPELLAEKAVDQISRDSHGVFVISWNSFEPNAGWAVSVQGSRRVYGRGRPTQIELTFYFREMIFEKSNTRHRATLFGGCSLATNRYRTDVLVFAETIVEAQVLKEKNHSATIYDLSKPDVEILARPHRRRAA